jgi:recombination protein RecA
MKKKTEKKKSKKELRNDIDKRQKEINKKKGSEKDFDRTIKEINTEYGEGTIIKLSEAPKINVATIPTGALSLDFAIGVGGIPKGRIIEVFGPESSGKSTLCLSIAKNCQKLEGRVVYIDAENGMDSGYAEAIGVDINKMAIVQPDFGEQA